MASLNVVCVSGNLTRDPELKTLTSGVVVCNMRIAINDRVKDRDGNWKDKPLFVDVATWQGTAEVCARYLVKGSPVTFNGKLRMEEWTDEASGQTRTKLSINARDAILPPKGSGGGREDGPPPSAAADDDDIPFMWRDHFDATTL